MKQVSVYDLIKKQNGEHFAKAIRNYNNGIFEIPNIVNIVKYAGTEAEPILPYLMSLMDIKIKEVECEDPFVLLKKAGYNAYYADTLEKQNAISKYFRKDEELCTFRDDNRFKKYYIVNAVKENVDDIKRENFTNPRREDEYGTSVISIQMLKYGGFISIKNRYNHTVENPDHTFNSNPDNIIEGLSHSLKKYFDVDFVSRPANLSDNFILIKHQLVKYNQEVNGYLLGDGFYVKDGNIIEINKQYEVMMDYFILNMKEKVVRSIITESDHHTNEAIIFTNEIKDKTLQIVQNKDKTKTILLNNKEFVTLDHSQMKRLTLNEIVQIPSFFLYLEALQLQYLSCPNANYIGSDVLHSNNTLTHCDFPKVKHIGISFLRYNKNLQYLNIPNVETICPDFLHKNKSLKSLNLPFVKYIGENFLYSNSELKNLYMPNVEKIGKNALYYNAYLKNLYFPKDR